MRRRRREPMIVKNELKDRVEFCLTMLFFLHLFEDGKLSVQWASAHSDRQKEREMRQVKA